MRSARLLMMPSSFLREQAKASLVPASPDSHLQQNDRAGERAASLQTAGGNKDARRYVKDALPAGKRGPARPWLACYWSPCRELKWRKDSEIPISGLPIWVSLDRLVLAACLDSLKKKKSLGRKERLVCAGKESSSRRPLAFGHPRFFRSAPP